MSSPATWPPRGEGGVEGAGAEEAGQRDEKKTPKNNKYKHIRDILFFVHLLVSSASVSFLPLNLLHSSALFYRVFAFCFSVSSFLFCAFSHSRFCTAVN